MTTPKDIIVNKAFFQFLNKGYKACTLKDLERVTGLTKGAFYYYFKNKEEILKEGLARYATVIEDIEEEKFRGIHSLKAYIEVILQEKERRAERLRELFGTFIIEEFYFQLVLEVEYLFPEYRWKIDVLLKNRLSRWEEIILKAKQEGEIRESLDTSVLARTLMSVPMSMVNIELLSADLKYAFSDMRIQFEQYYMLIKK
ncbi:TetR/AcrR family transcriptional regulator [uncultured Odoribacter sp.]|uniref:TetR/AcrR family transcriptional regulator n=1 Tax=uncultured Odoribacter sp. TaxID=876416 RepID=UPI00260E32F6|nr:TetR/AcrR family transcriptional regulator [uncultured Odoribacter sp.]